MSNKQKTSCDLWIHRKKRKQGLWQCNLIGCVCTCMCVCVRMKRWPTPLRSWSIWKALHGFYKKNKKSDWSWTRNFFLKRSEQPGSASVILLSLIYMAAPPSPAVFFSRVSLTLDFFHAANVPVYAAVTFCLNSCFTWWWSHSNECTSKLERCFFFNVCWLIHIKSLCLCLKLLFT